jgi:mannose-6-phosphate isomerase-like protein (cupin superfamily)
MADFTAKRIDDMAATFQGGFKLARAELGVSAWGMQILDLPPNLNEGYPNHDHSETGQEEVFVTLRGSATMTIDGEDVELTPDVLVRVGPAAKRCIRTGPDGARILALGGTPGSAYEINPQTELSAATA